MFTLCAQPCVSFLPQKQAFTCFTAINIGRSQKRLPQYIIRLQITTELNWIDNRMMTNTTAAAQVQLKISEHSRIATKRMDRKLASQVEAFCCVFKRGSLEEFEFFLNLAILKNKSKTCNSNTFPFALG